jgi:hypothetical protein
VGTSGGIFNVEIVGSGDPLYDFDTFCVQTLEYVNYNTEYLVKSVSKKTLGGAQNGVDLGSFAAWLYTGFLGLDFVSIPGFNDTSLEHVDTLQAGIWLSMGYSVPIAYNATLLGTWHDLYTASSWSSGTANANAWNWGYETGNVQIMNLVGSSNTDHKQDQLVHIPGTGNPPPPEGAIPEPMSFFVWSMLAMCVGTLGVRRRD